MYYYYISVVHCFINAIWYLKHCARRIQVRTEYWKKTWSKWIKMVLQSRVLLLSSNQEFYIQNFSLQVLFNMDTHSNPRRALKSVQEQEDWRWRRNEGGRARRAAETVEQRSKRLRKRRQRDHARRTAQTANKGQATSQTPHVQTPHVQFGGRLDGGGVLAAHSS